MKMFSSLFLVACGLAAVLGAPEAPQAPYAPSGWRPKGPAFELPTRTAAESTATDNFGAPLGPSAEAGEEATDVEVSQEEVMYAGDLATTEATTPFQEYGPPASELPEDQTTAEPGDQQDNELFVQGLPGSEPAKEFRNLPTLDARQQVQRLRVPARAQPARIQAAKPVQQNQIFSQQQQYTQRQFAQQQQQFGFAPAPAQFVSAPRPAQFAPARLVQPQQFGVRVAARPAVTFQQQVLAPVPAFGIRQNVRVQPAFNQGFVSQRQEALDSYGAPVQEYGAPPSSYGPPQGEAPQEELDQPQDLPQEDLSNQEPEINEEIPEGNDVESDPSSPNVAVSTSVASQRFIQQRAARPQRLRQGRAPTAAKLRANNLQQVTSPIFTYNQFGQLVRIY